MVVNFLILVFLPLFTAHVSQICKDFQKDASPLTFRTILASHKVVIPRTKAFGFKVNFHGRYFDEKLREEIINSDPNKLKVFLVNNHRPLMVMRDILTEKELQFVIQYQPSVRFVELTEIIIDDQTTCDDYYLDRTRMTDLSFDFRPSNYTIEKFKEFLLPSLGLENCGVAPATQRNKLSIGSEHVNDHLQYPWISAVYVKEEYKCTANLISREVAVTAAHCFDESSFKKEDIVLRLFNKQSVGIWELVLHKTYEKTRDDICLLYLNEVIADPDFAPVCLSADSSDINEIDGEVVSFGQDEYGETGNLKKLELSAVGKEPCRESNPALTNLVHDNNFCVGNMDGSGLCFGDSGAGFMVKVGNKWNLRGILSHSLKDIDGSCDTENYAVFVDAVKYSGWISKSFNASTIDLNDVDPKCKVDEYGFEFSLIPENQNWIVSIHRGDIFLCFGVLFENFVLSSSSLCPEIGNRSYLEDSVVEGRDRQGKTIVEDIGYRVRYSSNSSDPNSFNLFGSYQGEKSSHQMNTCRDSRKDLSRVHKVFTVTSSKLQYSVKTFIDKNVPILSKDECTKLMNFTNSDEFFCIPKKDSVAQFAFNIYETELENSYFALIGVQAVVLEEYVVMTNVSAYLDWFEELPEPRPGGPRRSPPRRNILGLDQTGLDRPTEDKITLSILGTLAGG